MKEDTAKLLIEIIAKALADLKPHELSAKDILLDIPANSRFGDLTTNIALRLSSSLKQPRLKTAAVAAESIKNHLADSALKDYIEEVKAEGAGFVNFYFNNKYFYECLKEVIEKGEDSLKPACAEKKNILIEFVSANPTGPLSVAHARQAAVGDVLANILAFCGFKVKKEYYLNDVGNQINTLSNSVSLRIKELAGEKIDFPEEHYQGEYIYEIAKSALEHKIKPEASGDFAVKYILDIIKKELSDFGVRFDFWYSQKELEKSKKIEKALEFLKKKDFIYEKEGASWFKSTYFNDDKDRVVIKSDGSYTYLAPDIAYHQDKYKRGFDLLINIWGPDHHGYINRLKAAVMALGKEAETLSIIIVQLASIFKAGKPLQMSTRKGQYITLREVLDEVGVDAARFFFLMRRTSSHLNFDLEIAKKQTPENPVYYVQYAHARISSILRNSTIKVNRKGLDLTLLKEKEEIELIKKILQFTYILDIISKTLDPYILTVYLQELAESFHRFYDRHRVLGEDRALSEVRLALIQATKTVISQGLDLLGVSKPEKM
ncbi:MAG: arginine--tRNA ligase [Candidatus Omnitrophota bacterium]|nr:MAG: arginine--tRNA ligase [Candidatus Omnitrophota bacterium]